jgi:hypothetical protein
MYQAHVALLAWMEANGYRAAGGYRTTCTKAPRTPPTP